MFSMSDNMLATFICINAILVLFYYFNTLVLIPRLFRKRNWLVYALSIILCFLVFLNAPKPIADLVARPDAPGVKTEQAQENRKIRSKPKKLTHYPGSYLAFILVFSVGLSVAAIQQWLKSEDMKKEIEHERVNTELSLLKSQINPHFFFNTLNNIYSLAIVKSDQTAEAILKLSAIMRYVLTETDQKLVPLSNEIEFLRNYINLQSVRLTDKVKLHVEIDDEVDGHQVAPLLFIPFVENAFKYGVSTVEPSDIRIRLLSTGHRVLFVVENSVVPGAKHSTVNTGIGIANVKRRLELLYPGKHKLVIDEQPQNYKVTLEIELA
ncbi:MAG: two-component system sensor protein no kinase domain [Chitinophagaceae bacterium]|nr:two-component system sensor protein no kinase domain [Chitinophagaceae bacterium]